MTDSALLGLIMLFVMIAAIFIGFPIAFTLIAVALVLVRIVLRIKLIRMEREALRSRKGEPDHS